MRQPGRRFPSHFDVISQLGTAPPGCQAAFKSVSPITRVPAPSLPQLAPSDQLCVSANLAPARARPCVGPGGLASVQSAQRRTLRRSRAPSRTGRAGIITPSPRPCGANGRRGPAHAPGRSVESRRETRMKRELGPAKQRRQWRPPRGCPAPVAYKHSPTFSVTGRAEVRRSFITTTVRDESQVTPQGRHR